MKQYRRKQFGTKSSKKATEKMEKCDRFSALQHQASALNIPSWYQLTEFQLQVAVQSFQR